MKNRIALLFPHERETLLDIASEDPGWADYHRESACFLSQAAGRVLMAADIDAPPCKRGFRLSEREAEVLQRISLGDSNKEAARALQISPATVRTHIESIFRKLECSTRAAATLKALTLGMI